MKKQLFIAMALLSLGVTSCKDDVTFDQETYDNLIKEAFPVKNVDPNHQWETVSKATGSITVNGDYGETYKVGLYLGHPELSTAKQLYMGKVKSGETLDVAFSHPVATDIVYIGIFDKDGRRIYMNAPIVNGHMDAVYGASDNASHRATEAEAPQYAKTLNDYLNPANTQNVISEDAMKQYPALTDDVIATQATLTDGTWTWSQEKGSYQVFPGGGDGKHWYIAPNTTITKVFHVNGTYGVYNDVVIYVEGKMHVNGNTLNGPTIVVADGGELIIDGNTSCTNAGRFIIMAGGKMTGTDGKLWDNSNGSYCYNAGTIKFNGIMNLNGTNFYNNGTVDVDVLTGTAGNTKFTNFGKITANTNSYNSSAFNQTWVNGCYVHFKSGAGLGSSIMLSGSRFDIDGECRDATGTIEMHSQSQLKVGGKLFANNLTINGPTNNSEYAIVKIGGLATWGGGLQTNNRVFFDFDPNEVYDNNNPSNKHSEHNRNAVLGYIHYWVNEKNALNEITIPEGCGGTAGFNPEGNEGDEVIPEPESFSMRYCFEDNFPTPGDYDFNDVVLTVTPTLNDKTLTIKVSLDAVGGTETIAAAMRLVGVNSSDLVSYTVTKAFPSIDEMSWGATYHNIEHSDGFVKEDENPNNTTNMVIVLFKDAHWAINPENDNSGGPKRVFYNTVEPGDFYTNDVPPTTAIYTLVFNDEDKAKSMLAKNLYDVFIVEPYNGSYWEVHTVENGFKTLQVITPTKPEGYSQAYGDNMPWAIMVSGDFKYPYEWKSITNAYKEPGHSFAEWAENSSTANDWYDHPTSGLVYE
ncbi:MAG: LruC domain-containing protein [Prevotella sp.]|nr:LruC domain-containing protein [Prevotella sp.]